MPVAGDLSTYSADLSSQRDGSLVVRGDVEAIGPAGTVRWRVARRRSWQQIFPGSKFHRGRERWGSCSEANEEQTAESLQHRVELHVCERVTGKIKRIKVSQRRTKRMTRMNLLLLTGASTDQPLCPHTKECLLLYLDNQARRLFMRLDSPFRGEPPLPMISVIPRATHPWL